jgi:hypothetical protein
MPIGITMIEHKHNVVVGNTGLILGDVVSSTEGIVKDILGMAPSVRSLIGVCH